MTLVPALETEAKGVRREHEAAELGARTRRAERPRCALVARARGEDPIGMAGTFDRYVCIERPLPWPEELWDADHLPHALATLAQVPELCTRSTKARVRVRALGIAPDAEYSVAGHTRVLAFQRPRGQFAAFERHEYLLPDGELAWALEPILRADLPAGGAPELAAFRVRLDGAGASGAGNVAEGPRDALVCTHGTVDGCCAHLGYPAYRTLRHDVAPQLGGAVRVWRVSHFGGHRLAPTLVDWPEGRWWGLLDEESLEAVVRRDGPAAAVTHRYRGWSGLGFFGQVAERELLARFGWTWTGYRVREQVLEVNGVPVEQYTGTLDHPQFAAAAPERARVRLEFVSPAGVAGAIEAEIEQTGVLPLQGECAQGEEGHPQRVIAQYRVRIED